MAQPTGFWNAFWVSPTPDPSEGFGTWAFRRVAVFDEKPASLVARVSADQRFRLYVNGVMAAHGPARGDLKHWPYDEVDLAPYLREGRNTLHAVVWHQGWAAPMAQISSQPAFIFDAPGLDTPGEWTCARIESRAFLNGQPRILPTYFACGPCEVLKAGGPPLEDLGAEDAADWKPIGAHWTGNPDAGTQTGPSRLMRGKEEGSDVGEAPWWLVRRSIPAMTYAPFSGRASIVEKETEDRAPFAPCEIGPGKPLLLDMKELVNGYPRIRLKGRGLVQVIYAEALHKEFAGEPWRWTEGKAHRDATKGMTIMGQSDRVELEGEALFEPLWWRSFRYVQIECSDRCTVEGFDVMETGYPIPQECAWSSDNDADEAIIEVALRTARRCAGETYFDCPYYEQLQYVADTRIQAMVGRYASRDRRLQKQAIEAFANSHFHAGLTQSRYPSREPQVIPGFSLWWIHMLADQHLYDAEPVSSRHWKIADDIIDWWDDALDGGGAGEYWPYADWVPAWSSGNPPGGIHSSIQALLLLYTKIVLARTQGDADRLVQLHGELAEWQEDESGRVFHGIKSWESPLCQHTAALLRLCQAHWGPVRPWPTGADEGSIASFFYQWYIHQARPYDDYDDLLAPWHAQLAIGLSTFAENAEPTRSDCHAWSAHPLLGYFQRVAGVTSAAQGWSRAQVAPNPGRRNWFSATVPHPAGDLRVAYGAGKLKVESPVPFRLVWGGRTEEHSAGTVEVVD